MAGSAGAPYGIPRQSWIRAGLVDQPLVDQLAHEHEVAGVEHLELWAHAELLDDARHRAEHPRRVDHHVVAARGEVHAAAVERADLGPQLRHVGQPLRRANHVGARGVRRERRLVPAEDEVAPHPGGEVEHDIDVRSADALDHVSIERQLACRLAGDGVADVDVRDRGSGLGGLDRGGGDLLRRDRHPLAAARRVACAGDRARDEDLAVQDRPSPTAGILTDPGSRCCRPSDRRTSRVRPPRAARPRR